MAEEERELVIVGAGGFAREVEWLAREITAHGGPRRSFAGYVVSDLDRLGAHDSRDQVLGDYTWFERRFAERPDHRVDVAIGVGHAGARRRIGRELSARFDRIDWPSLVHPSVTWDAPSVSLGRGVLVCAGVTGTVHLRLDDFCMVNLSCTLGHESHIGEGAVLNPDVNVSGGVEVGAAVLVGTGAQLLQYRSIGEGATVGAGAVVAKDVPPGATVVGVPARPR